MTDRYWEGYSDGKVDARAETDRLLTVIQDALHCIEANKTPNRKALEQALTIPPESDLTIRVFGMKD